METIKEIFLRKEEGRGQIDEETEEDGIQEQTEDGMSCHRKGKLFPKSVVNRQHLLFM